MTAPVRDAFIAMCHTDLTKDLNNINSFIPKWNYPRLQIALFVGILKSSLIQQGNPICA